MKTIIYDKRTGRKVRVMHGAWCGMDGGKNNMKSDDKMADKMLSLFFGCVIFGCVL